MGCSQAERGMGLRLPEPVVHLLRRPSQPVVCIMMQGVSFCLPVCLLVCLSSPQSACVSWCKVLQFVCLSVCLFVCSSSPQSACGVSWCKVFHFVCLYVCLFVYLCSFISLRRIIQVALVCLFVCFVLTWDCAIRSVSCVETCNNLLYPDLNNGDKDKWCLITMVWGCERKLWFMEVIPAPSIIIFSNRFVIFAAPWADENPISQWGPRGI